MDFITKSTLYSGDCDGHLGSGFASLAWA